MTIEHIIVRTPMPMQSLKLGIVLNKRINTKKRQATPVSEIIKNLSWYFFILFALLPL